MQNKKITTANPSLNKISFHLESKASFKLHSVLIQRLQKRDKNLSHQDTKDLNKHNPKGTIWSFKTPRFKPFISCLRPCYQGLKARGQQHGCPPTRNWNFFTNHRASRGRDHSGSVFSSQVTQLTPKFSFPSAAPMSSISFPQGSAHKALPDSLAMHLLLSK